MCQSAVCKSFSATNESNKIRREELGEALVSGVACFHHSGALDKLSLNWDESLI
jgi:hypothetical protein